MQQICFNQNLFLIFILTSFIIIIVFANIKIDQKKIDIPNNDNNTTLVSNKYNIPTSDFVNDKIDQRDEDALENPLKPVVQAERI